jgi:predicted DNA-binding protein (MmcQ/YjbR family)
MDIEQLRQYLLQKKGVTDGLPFGPTALVFKVLDKMFAIIALNEATHSISLKMDKDLVPEWREKYEAVQEGYHLNKSMWNTVDYNNNSLPKKELLWLIDHSYEQVILKFTKKQKEILQAL